MRQLRFIFITLALMLACVACDGEVAAKSEDVGSGDAKGRHLGLAPILASGLVGPYGYGGYPPYGPYGPAFGYRHVPIGYGGVYPPGVYPPPYGYNPNFGGYYGGGFYG